MYRKHLRMARGKGEVESEGVRSHFVERVVKLPMIHVAWDYATNTYSSLKEYNRLVNFTLTNAEKSVTFVAEQAKPVVMKFGKQLQAVDDLACKTLGTLEEKVPIITKSPDEIIDDTKDLYNNTVQSRFDHIREYGENKVKTVKDLGMHAVSGVLSNSLVTYAISTVDDSLVVAEHYIDYYLPAESENSNNHNMNSKKKETDDGPVSVPERFTRILHILQRRGYNLVILRIRSVHEQTLNLLNAPEHMLSVIIQNFEALNRYARSQWVTLNAEETEEDQHSKNFVTKRIVPFARPLFKQLVVLYISIAELIPVPAPKDKKSESNNSTNNNGSHKPAFVDAVNGNIMRIVGVLRTAPAIVPMYIYAILMYLSGKKETEASQSNDTRKADTNSTNEKSEQNHVHENNTSSDLD